MGNKKENGTYKADLFISKSKVGCPDVQAYLDSNHITVHEYDDLDKRVTELSPGWSNSSAKKIELDEGAMSYKVINLLKKQNFTIVNKSNIVSHIKASKNKVQMEGMRKANVKDSAAIMKYFAYLDEQLLMKDH